MVGKEGGKEGRGRRERGKEEKEEGERRKGKESAVMLLPRQ